MEHSLLLLYFYYKGSYIRKIDTSLLDAYYKGSYIRKIDTSLLDAYNIPRYWTLTLLTIGRLQRDKKALKKYRGLFTILKDLS